jgi:hypothetical protein
VSPLAALLGLVAAAGAAEAGSNLVIVTVDGVRWSEVFQGPDPVLDRSLPGLPDLAPTFPRLWARLRTAGGFLTGDVAAGDPFKSQNLAVCSLPGYQSIFAGRDLGCLSNDCPPLTEETVLERVGRELGLDREAVAVFAGWPPIARAVARDPSRLVVNVGYDPAPRLDGPAPDPGADALDRAQRQDRPPWDHRWDRYTWAQAMRYLERRRPRVLYVGLGDPDEWGHRRDYRSYLASLRELDVRIEELEARLAGMGAWGARTSVLVTTDHGRGDGADWTSHGTWHRGSERGFLYARTPHTGPATVRSAHGPYGHLNLRPTIERLLGLAPCQGCRRPIAELLPRDELAGR